MYPHYLQYAHQCDDSICVHHHHFSPWHYLGEHCTLKRNRLRLTCRAWSRRPAQDAGTGTGISFHSAGSTAHQNQIPNKLDVYTHSTDCDWIDQHGGLAAIVISKEVADAGKAVSSLSTIFRRRRIGGFQKLSAGWGAAATPFFGRVEIAWPRFVMPHPWVVYKLVGNYAPSRHLAANEHTSANGPSFTTSFPNKRKLIY